MTGSLKSISVEFQTVLALDLADEEQALRVARELAQGLQRTIVVADAQGNEIAVQPWKTLDS